ncbi:MAG: radical SAM protein [Oscillospiraceae bacterium]|nr:radical SAM protein [Oscillospiraceae bacterium]
MSGDKKKHVLQWHILHRCNLHCTHCYQDEHASELSFDVLERLFRQYIDFCAEYGYKGHINITGGEPLLSEHLFPLLSLLEEYGMTFGLLTNGTLIDSTVTEKLAAFSRLSFVQVSIDGTRETHDSIRGAGNFDKAMAGLRLLHNAGIQTMAAFTCHRRNYKELRDVIKLARKAHADRFWADRLIPFGGNTEDILTTGEFREMLHVLSGERSRKTLFKGTQVHMNRAMQFLGGGDYYQCAAGVSLLTLLADGTLLPCRRLPIPVGNCLEQDMRTLYRESKLIAQLCERNIPEECMPCPKAHLCRGGAKCLTYAVTGRFDGKDINCYWGMSK